ncbi:hypothetical protein TNCT1_19010 [Streptomyces sp. 1-11]|nr:hypothetical protein TNCT1_19010 [Streptomyces sp. 1-11]
MSRAPPAVAIGEADAAGAAWAADAGGAADAAWAADAGGATDAGGAAVAGVAVRADRDGTESAARADTRTPRGTTDKTETMP